MLVSTRGVTRLETQEGQDGQDGQDGRDSQQNNGAGVSPTQEPTQYQDSDVDVHQPMGLR